MYLKNPSLSIYCVLGAFIHILQRCRVFSFKFSFWVKIELKKNSDIFSQEVEKSCFKYYVVNSMDARNTNSSLVNIVHFMHEFLQSGNWIYQNLNCVIFVS